MENTDKERIERLEQMVKTLNQKLRDICGVINIGSYNYELSDIAHALYSVKEFREEDRT
jgi:uncharacterized protein (UPF0335 family)